MPTVSQAYDVVWSHAVPLATALYLLEADLRKCAHATGAHLPRPS